MGSLEAQFNWESSCTDSGKYIDILVSYFQGDPKGNVDRSIIMSLLLYQSFITILNNLIFPETF